MIFSEIFPRTKHPHNSSLPKFKMASSTISHIRCYFLFYATTSQLFCVNAQAASYKNISLGSSLYANYENLTWTSPSGDFAFGFHRLVQGSEDKFLLAIWFAKIPEKTIVWTANGKSPTDRDSKVELTNGQLVLITPNEWELWKSSNVNQMEAVEGAMLDTGNFVIASTKSGSNIWESFNDPRPRDTILPGQVLGVGSKLSSTASENDYKPGKFQLVFLNGNVILVQIDVFSGNPYSAYFEESNVSQLIFNESGHIQVMKMNNSSNSSSMVNLTPENMTVGKKDLYLRAKLNFDGVFTLYSHPKNISSGNETWSVMFFIPDNICLSIIDTFGSGPCGFNSICELGKHGKPICRCPPGFSPLDPNNQYNGCKQDDVSYLQQCNQEGSNLDEDRFEFVAVDGADWPLADYEQLKPSTEFECRRACLRDCYCAVAIFLEGLVNEMGTCWKKKLPLSNGRFDLDRVNRKALFKIPKSNSSLNNPPDPNSDRKDQDRTTLILAVLLGTSVFFNFFSVTAIILSVYCLFQRKLQGYFAVPTVRDMELNNLRSFTYKDLEVATNRFKEELGRGAFGTVYKGVLASAFGDYVAVKKLDKMQQEGEKEFKTEVNVIGQTHHRNLVRLLGYCNEDEHRILVYEFMHNGSLSSFLFGIIRPGWQQRLQIVSGIARGLMYLHEECSMQIIHCDIKPQNILLDDTYTAKISDFGLAKRLINNHTKTLTGIRGTKGYVAPEWFRNTPVTVKVDVYSFGIVLLEILCCRKSVEMEMEKEEEAILADWAYECYKEGRLDYLVENDEEAISDMKRLEKMVKIGIWCVQDEPLSRPSMRAVTQMLDGVLEVSPPPCPSLFSSMS